MNAPCLIVEGNLTLEMRHIQQDLVGFGYYMDVGYLQAPLPPPDGLHCVITNMCGDVFIIYAPDLLRIWDRVKARYIAERP